MDRLQKTNTTIIWSCGHRKAFSIDTPDSLYCVQVSEYPCPECGGWHWGEGPGDIAVAYPRTRKEYIDFSLTGTDEDQMKYPDGLDHSIGAISCWIED